MSKVGYCLIAHTAVDCGRPPLNNTTDLRVNFTNTTFRNVAKYSCNGIGLELVGNDTIVCQASGNWSNGNTVPVCQCEYLGWINT